MEEAGLGKKGGGSGQEGEAAEGRDGDVQMVVDILASSSGQEDAGGSGASLLGSQGGGNGGVGEKAAVGFAAILQRMGEEGKTAATVVAELKWQREVNGETAKIDAFIEKTISLQEFKAFAFMKAGSPWVQVGHGFGKFYSLYGMVPELDGKVLMFVGDRGWTRDPFPVQPPTQNTWKWITVNAANDGGALQAFAQADTGLWQPGAGAVAREDVKVPYILALPTVAVEFIMARGGSADHTSFFTR